MLLETKILETLNKRGESNIADIYKEVDSNFDSFARKMGSLIQEGKIIRTEKAIYKLTGK